MPKNEKQEAASKNSYKPSNLQWINPTPNEKDISWLESNGDGFVPLLFDFLDDIQENERLSVKRDTQSSRWLAILFTGDGDSRNSGQALSLRGATPADAVILLAYFHVFRFKGEYPNASVDDSGRWG